MSAPRFARPYAQALWKRVPDPEPARLVRDELQSFAETLVKVPALLRAFEAPAVPLEAKHRTCDEVARQLGLGELARRFLSLLVDNRRVSGLPAILRAFEVLLDDKLGVVRAEVSCAHALNERQRAALQTLLERRLRAQVVVVERLDPELLAGFVVQVGSERFDVSLRSQLHRLAASMAEGE